MPRGKLGAGLPGPSPSRRSWLPTRLCFSPREAGPAWHLITALAEELALRGPAQPWPDAAGTERRSRASRSLPLISHCAAGAEGALRGPFLLPLLPQVHCVFKKTKEFNTWFLWFTVQPNMLKDKMTFSLQSIWCLWFSEHYSQMVLIEIENSVFI